MTQLTLAGDEADPEPDPTLDEGEPVVWDDGSTSPTWECPECGFRLFAEGTCDCGWFDRERWDATLGRGGDTDGGHDD